MNRKGVELSPVIQMVLWGAIIILVAYLIYAFVVKGGSGPLPGENLLG